MVWTHHSSCVLKASLRPSHTPSSTSQARASLNLFESAGAAGSAAATLSCPQLPLFIVLLWPAGPSAESAEASRLRCNLKEWQMSCGAWVLAVPACAYAVLALCRSWHAVLHSHSQRAAAAGGHN